MLEMSVHGLLLIQSRYYRGNSCGKSPESGGRCCHCLADGSSTAVTLQRSRCVLTRSELLPCGCYFFPSLSHDRYYVFTKVLPVNNASTQSETIDRNKMKNWGRRRASRLPHLRPTCAGGWTTTLCCCSLSSKVRCLRRGAETCAGVRRLLYAHAVHVGRVQRFRRD